MQVLITIALIIIGVLLFEFIIFAHEFGHFITAKKSGVQVNEFALGMGPKLFSFKKGETTYSLRFLLMLVVTAFQTEFIDTTISGFAPYAYTANAGLREGDKVVSVGGYPVANSRDLALGIQLLPCEEVDPQSVTVFKQDCCTDATNYIYTMRDELKQIDDETASTLYYPKDCAYPEIEVRDKRLRYTGDVSVIRDGEKQELKGVQFYTYKSGEDKTAVGIDFYLLPKEKNFGTVMEETFTGTVSLAKSVWKSLELLVCGRFHLTDMSGPVGITKAVSDVAAVGLQTGFGDAVLNIVMIMALITVNLGIVNMLPFPALDGGRFVFLVIEAITHRHLPRKVEYIVNGIGLALLILLIVFVSFNDIFKLFTGGFDSMT